MFGCEDLGSSKIDLVLDQAKASGGEPKCDVSDELDCEQGVRQTFSECCFEGSCSKDLVSISDASLECSGSDAPTPDDFATVE